MDRIISIIIIGISCIYSLNANALTLKITETAQLLASDGAASDAFGTSVAIDGTTAIIGMPGDDDLGSESGSAYIFTRDGNGAWNQHQKLTPSDGASDDDFGWTVALDGDTAVIGVTYGDFFFNPLPGAVYVFKRDSTGVWSEQQKLTTADGSNGDSFGSSVAINGDTLVVGASGDDTLATGAGAAFVFTRDATGIWSLQQKLTATSGVTYDYFGSQVTVDGDTAAIAASGYDYSSTITNSGSVYVFTRDSTGVWTQQQRLTPHPTDVEGKLFGKSIAMSGETLVIGADFDDTIDLSAGAAYVFTRDSAGVWNEQQKLLASDGAGSDYFGMSVDIDGNNLVVGAYGDDDNGDHAGSAYVFSRDANGDWNEQVKLLASDGEFWDYMTGTTSGVSISGNTVVAGAQLYDTSAGNSVGTAYVFDTSPTEGPDISLSTGSVDFGDVPVGETAQNVVTLTNYGTAVLTLSGIAVANGIDFSQTNNCPASLLPLAACQITVSFTPTVSGTLADSLTILSDDPDEPSVTVALFGNGLTAFPDLVVTNINSPNPLPAGGYATISITIANQGTADVSGGYYVHLYLDDSEIGMDWIGSAPAAGANMDVSWFVALPNYQGNHTLKAIVDTLDDILESDETNNELTQSVFLQR